MTHITIADRRYRLLTTERDGRWMARAERETPAIRSESNAPATANAEATARLTRWLEWQREHAAALEELQRAERAYHRTIAGSAFASPTEGPSAIEMQKESLEAVEAARLRLDEIRGRKPEIENTRRAEDTEA